MAISVLFGIPFLTFFRFEYPTQQSKNAITRMIATRNSAHTAETIHIILDFFMFSPLLTLAFIKIISQTLKKVKFFI